MVGQLDLLVATSVFLLAVGYAATCASIFPLRSKNPDPQFKLRGATIIAVLGVLFSLYLMSQCTLEQIGISVVLLAVGVPIYILYSPKRELPDLKRALTSKDAIHRQVDHIEHNFLAHLLFHVKRFYRRFSARRSNN